MNASSRWCAVCREVWSAVLSSIRFGVAVLVPALMIVAMLLLRVGIGELRRPGSARRQWLFLGNRTAVAAGAVAVILTVGTGWFFIQAGVLLWAVLIGLLVALITDRLSGDETSAR
ncbi:hypothetical protein [Streptomyces coelicoflavus]|uniref:hypothetical protein n=1 Tax=Streptomyces coelicoflavus TaxID=285562 RepID=UPI003635DF33